ncbi:hypothetical protein N665_0693s0029 [Sinapis alba]|nr:hypothetical protein N665_0693s0029 [Sinapis alba]
MATSTGQASTTESGDQNDRPVEITPKYCCSNYFITTMIFSLVPLAFVSFIIFVNGKQHCYIDLFTHSISVSTTANVSTADWKTGLIAKSPVTKCKLSLQTVTSRLLRGDEVISQASPSLDGFGRFVTFGKTDESVSIVDFRNVVLTSQGVNGSVIWDYRVESIVRLNAEFAHGFLSVICRDIPVKFTADESGSVFGSLVGGMRRCEYLLRDNLNYF